MFLAGFSEARTFFLVGDTGVAKLSAMWRLAALGKLQALYISAIIVINSM